MVLGRFWGGFIIVNCLFHYLFVIFFLSFCSSLDVLRGDNVGLEVVDKALCRS